MKQCIAHLRLNPQVVIVDEVDYLVSHSKEIETLRDLHDLTGIPVVLMGMQEFKTKLGKFRHLFDRISEIVEFKPFSKEDTEYDPLAVCCYIRYNIEEKVYNSIPDEFKNKFLDTHRTIQKLDLAVDNNIDIPKKYYLLNLIHKTLCFKTTESAVFLPSSVSSMVLLLVIKPFDTNLRRASTTEARLMFNSLETSIARIEFPLFSKL